MSRILSFDYGEKRTGVAASDPLQMIANGITTLDTKKDLFPWIKAYMAEEDVETILIGFPTNLRNERMDITPVIEKFAQKLKNLYPKVEVTLYDERYTSKMAFQTMIDSGISKKARRNKGLIDQISATILLQNYMESKHPLL